MDHLVVVFSDIEMGAGGITDDYPDTTFLEELLEGYCEPPYRDLAVTYVFNGDTFDLLKTPTDEGTYPSHITEAVATAKLDRVLRAHESFVETLGRLLQHTAAPRRALFLIGNHDQELSFPAVQRRLAAAIGVPDKVSFPGLEWRVGDVLVEHGSQHDTMFAIDPAHPLVRHGAEELLNIPWGTIALLEVAMPFHPVLYPMDRLRPYRHVFDALPEIRDLLLDEYWRYWTHDYWTQLFTDPDPLRRVTWTMFSEIAYRFGTGDPEVSTSDGRRLLRRRDGANVIVMGHEHEPGLSSLDGRRLLRTGCFRHEYLLDLASGAHRPLPKVYAEVFLREERATFSQLVEVEEPPPDPPRVPHDVGVLLERVHEHLRASSRQPERDARDAQLAAERGEQGGEPRSSAPAFLRTLRHLLER